MVDGNDTLAVSPVSFEPLAVLLPILHVRASRAILLRTTGSDIVFKRVKLELESRGVAVEHSDPVSPTDANSLIAAMRESLVRLNHTHVVVNLTSGTKVMCAAVALEGSRRGAELVYADTGDDRILRHLDGVWVGEPLAVPGLDVATFIRLAGRVGHQSHSIGAFPELARFLGLNAPRLDVLLDPLRGPGLKKHLPLGHKKWLPEWDELLQHSKRCGLVVGWSRTDKELRVEFTNANAVSYLAGGFWLEDYAYTIARDCAFSGEVQRNIEILRPNGETHTDLDVAFVHRHRLFIVSCKAGSNLQHRQPFDELAENLGGLLAGAMVISTKQAGKGVAAADVGHARGVRVETVLLHDVPKLRSRLLSMSKRVARRPRGQAL